MDNHLPPELLALANKLTKDNKALADILEAAGITATGHNGLKSLLAFVKRHKQNEETARNAGYKSVETALYGARKRGVEPEPEPPTETELARISQAKTIAVFDTLLFTASTWTSEGETAPDIEVALKSQLFPTVYERVMEGDSDYYLDEVPENLDAVLQSVRELIRDTRELHNAAVSDAKVWNDLAPIIQQYVTTTLLKDIYGAEADYWKHDEPYTHERMMKYQQEPACRALEFPKIFDAMDMLKQHSEAIQAMGLGEFTKRSVASRLKPAEA